MNTLTDAALPDGKAAVLLEAVKALPLSDQEAFTKLFQAWIIANEQRQAAAQEQQDTPIEWPDFAGRIKAIFGERVLPGDPQEFWDEERGRTEE